MVTQFATAKAGLILVNINPAYRLSELEYALNKVGCRALITATSFKTSDYVGMINTLAPELRSALPGKLRAARLPDLEMVIQIGGARGAGDDPVRQRERHGGRLASDAACGTGAEAAVR